MPFAAPGQTIVTMGGRRVVVGSPAGSGGKTYAEFQAHITGLATSGTISWSADAFSAGSFKTTAAAATGSMIGSSWVPASYFRPSSTLARVVQHGLPSPAAVSAVIGTDLFVRIIAGVPTNVLSIDRNGYTSISDPDEEADTNRCDLILYWDGSPWQMNPSTGTGPTPYTW